MIDAFAQYERALISMRTKAALRAYPQGASPYGLLDMAGNVWEWTRSLWGTREELSWMVRVLGKYGAKSDYQYPYKAADGRENQGAGNEVARVLRGGVFSDSHGLVRGVRCADRHGRYPKPLLGGFGFRVVMHP
jgi:iron(II)-dependent oxidoreductase